MLIIHRTKFILSVTALVLGVATLTGCACEASDPPVKMADSLTAPAGSIPATTSGQSVTTSEQETGGSSESDPIVYSDPVFQKLLETELGKTAITPTDLDPYTRIVIGGDHFISLSGVDLPEKKLVLLFGTDVELDGVRYTGSGP